MKFIVCKKREDVNKTSPNTTLSGSKIDIYKITEEDTKAFFEYFGDTASTEENVVDELDAISRRALGLHSSIEENITVNKDGKLSF